MNITIWGPFDKNKQKELKKKIKKIDWKKERACCHEDEKTDLCVVHYAVMNSVCKDNTKRIFMLVEPTFAFNSTADAVVSYKLADIVSENIGNYHVECMIVKERAHNLFSGYRTKHDRF